MYARLYIHIYVYISIYMLPASLGASFRWVMKLYANRIKQSKALQIDWGLSNYIEIRQSDGYYR